VSPSEGQVPFSISFDVLAAERRNAYPRPA
jgi:hypothetical protein